MKQIILDALEQTRDTIRILIEEQNKWKEIAERLDIELDSGRKVSNLSEMKSFMYEVIRHDGVTDYGEIQAESPEMAKEKLKKQFRIVRNIF